MRAIAALTALAALSVAAPASGAQFDLSEGSKPITVGVEGDGSTVVSWRRGNDQEAAVRTAGTSAFGVPGSLLTLPNPAASFQLAHGGPGIACAAWVEGSAIPHTVRVAVRPAAGAPFEPAVTVSDPLFDSDDPQVVIAPDGTCVVVWSHYGPGGKRLHGAVRRPGATAFEALAAAVSEPGSGTDPEHRLAVDADGGVTAVWQRFRNQRQVIEGARLPAGATAFSPWRQLSGGGEHGFAPAVAVSPEGDATVAYEGRGEVDVIRAVTWPAASATPVDRQALSEPVDSTSHPDVAVGAAGDVTVVWQRAVLTDEGGVDVYIDDNIQAATRAADEATFGATKPVSPAGVGADAPQVVVGARGDTTVAFNAYDEAGSIRVQRAQRALEAADYTPPVTLSAPGANAIEPLIAIDPQGDVTIAWARAGMIHAETLDTGGPVLDGLSVPATAVAGEPVTVSVAPRDSASEVAETTWRFGDGGSAVGTTATHAYAGPGTYRVRVTAFDVNGNRASATRTIVVASRDGVAGPAGQGADVTKPAITRAKLSRRRVRPAGRGGVLARTAARRKGAKLTLHASEAGRLRITVQRRRKGRRARYRSLASATTAVKAGDVSRVLSGRGTRRALKRGRYRLRLVLTDAAGNASAPVALTFRVVG